MGAEMDARFLIVDDRELWIGEQPRLPQGCEEFHDRFKRMIFVNTAAKYFLPKRHFRTGGWIRVFGLDCRKIVNGGLGDPLNRFKRMAAEKSPSAGVKKLLEHPFPFKACLKTVR